MKVYVILVDYKNGRDTMVYGVYRRYRQARIEEERLLSIAETLWGGNQIKVRLVDQEVSE